MEIYLEGRKLPPAPLVENRVCGPDKTYREKPVIFSGINGKFSITAATVQQPSKKRNGKHSWMIKMFKRNKIYNGNSLDVIKTFPDNSIHMAVTSPPYYSPVEGLRNYRIDPETKLPYYDTKVNWADGWDGDLGMEPTPQQYICHLTEICTEVYRVLRPDAIFWLNLGDSRAGSGRGPSGKHAAIKNQGERQGFVGKQIKIPPGFKRKDVFGIPFRAGIALQEQGWYWRDTIPWIKRNSIPGSYTDRPISTIEWILILTKTADNYYDSVAVMEQSSESYMKDKRPKGVLRQRVNPNTKYNRETSQFKKQDNTGNSTYTNFNQRYKEAGSCDKRLLRSSDFFFKTWQGLWVNEEGDPLAMVVNPTAYRGKHFAGFPIMLPQTCIIASTSEKGVCPDCGAPWVRQAEKVYSEDRRDYQLVTKGWQPTCTCGCENTVPATVLDFFGGTSSTGVACVNTNRRYVGIEINPAYCELGETRMKEEGKPPVPSKQVTLDAGT